MNTQMDALTLLNQITETAKNNKARLCKVKGMKPGEVIRQGDIYVQKLEKLPANLGEVSQDAQLAIGQTQGSRHIISPMPKGLTIYAPAKGANPLMGPVVDSPVGFTITHPEHGHFKLEAGLYQITYQRDYSKERAEELRRVQD